LGLSVNPIRQTPIILATKSPRAQNSRNFAHFNPQPDDQSLRLPEVIKGDDEGLLRGERDDRRAGKK
jgi:hypothetical protein